MSSKQLCRRPGSPPVETDVELGSPRLDDGRGLWRLARDSHTLDLNSAYTYVLCCRDFAATSVVARDAGGVCGFVIGFARPEQPRTLFVWQVAVDPQQRGRGLARRMLDHLADERYGYLEATVTPENTASDRLFSSFARSRNAALRRTPLFGSELFPDEHEPEMLYRIGPLGTVHQ